MFGLNFTRIFLSIALLSLASVPASGANLLNTRFFNAQTFPATDFAAIFPGGSVTQNFNLATAKTVMISFSAVCSTSGTGNQFTSIQIQLDGTPAYPTNLSDGVLCGTAGAATNLDGRATSTLVTAVSLPAGSYDVRVQVTPHNGGVSRIDNLALLVWD
jgi:hypothetical protein